MNRHFSKKDIQMAKCIKDEKVLTIIYHQRNANQNHNEIYHLTPVRMAKIKNSRNKCWQECGTKGTLVYLLVGIPTGIASKENSVEILSKVKNRSTCYPAITLLGMYPKNAKTLIQRDTCTPLCL